MRGIADIPKGSDHNRCLEAYFSQYPDAVERTHDPDIVPVRVRPNCLRYSDYQTVPVVVDETTLGN